jgi:hypothetical protein
MNRPVEKKRPGLVQLRGGQSSCEKAGNSQVYAIRRENSSDVKS